MWIKTTFGFSLCTIPLLIIQVTFFGSELEDLESRKPQEDGKVCHC